MKITKLILLTFLLLSTNLFAHSIPGIVLEAEKIENNQIQINAKFKKSGRKLIGNKIKLISMIDNRVLFEEKITIKGLITDIPKESYWIYLIVRDNDVVMDGPAPSEGFDIVVKKEPKAFSYTLTLSAIFLILSIALIILKKRRNKRD